MDVSDIGQCPIEETGGSPLAQGSGGEVGVLVHRADLSKNGAQVGNAIELDLVCNKTLAQLLVKLECEKLRTSLGVLNDCLSGVVGRQILSAN
jgi:hypothetical protein